MEWTVLRVSIAADSTCADISTDACRLLVHAAPNFCSTLSGQTDCPAFCGLCSRRCYQCHEVNNPADCSTSVTCGVGKECIVSETIGDDFTYHFNVGCVEKSVCTSGSDLPHPSSAPGIVGKRAVLKRNLEFACCDSDLCNNKLPSALQPTSCPSGTHEFRDGSVHLCYFVLKQERNADDGARACATAFKGGKLAYIPSDAADNFIKLTFKGDFSGDHSGAFIGVFDKEHELSFVDTDGSPQTFFDWRHGQPNDPNVNDPHREPAQDCVRMFPVDGEHFTWQDKPCEQLGWALCSINIHK
ncbi:mannose-binding protein C-like isoform X2 [Saccostrea echinata]|uniref:mannose-binding protein C-like isoform X2 n=1 Tax=Saccostrea echinata TaxID=191078 RepID=UPI002A831FE6|nr:mannose-binding protein C-like isoform X2 [Saccostrea echinata]